MLLLLIQHGLAAAAASAADHGVIAVMPFLLCQHGSCESWWPCC